MERQHLWFQFPCRFILWRKTHQFSSMDFVRCYKDIINSYWLCFEHHQCFISRVTIKVSIHWKSIPRRSIPLLYTFAAQWKLKHEVFTVECYPYSVGSPIFYFVITFVICIDPPTFLSCLGFVNSYYFHVGIEAPTHLPH